MSPRDHDLLAHRTWLGYVEKSGLVVSASALVAAQTHIDESSLLAAQQGLLALFSPTEADQKRFSRELDRVAVAEGDDRRWGASPEARFERLLRETGVPIGVLANGTHLRIVHASRGESSGHLTFSFKSMCEVAGRPLLGGLLLLLDADRLFTGPKSQRLPALLRDSRKHQNNVSTALGEQILGALDELVRGFQAADEARRGQAMSKRCGTRSSARGSMAAPRSSSWSIATGRGLGCGSLH